MVVAVEERSNATHEVVVPRRHVPTQPLHKAESAANDWTTTETLHHQMKRMENQFVALIIEIKILIGHQDEKQ